MLSPEKAQDIARRCWAGVWTRDIPMDVWQRMTAAILKTDRAAQRETLEWCLRNTLPENAIDIEDLLAKMAKEKAA